MKEGTIFFALVFPRPWPPIDEVEFHSQSLENGSLTLFFGSDACITARLTHLGEKREYRFNKISIHGSGSAVLCFSWSPLNAELWLNKLKIPFETESVSSSIEISTSNSAITLPPTEVKPPYVIPEHAEKNEALFLNTILDIFDKTNTGTQYSLLRASALLRQLLLDAQPLVHVLNRDLRLKLTFQTIDYKTPPPIAPNYQAINLDAQLFPQAKTLDNNLTEFLSAPCLVSDGVTACVKDLIKACAHVQGGVHLGSTKTEAEGLVIKWDESFKILGNAPSTHMLAGVCRVSLMGLEPLVRAVLDKIEHRQGTTL